MKDMKTVSEIIEAMGLSVLTEVFQPDAVISKGYAGDMLSHDGRRDAAGSGP